MKRYWVRFMTSNAEDCRPVVHPPPCQWWCTGYAGDDSYATVCAIVDTDGDPLQVVRAGWPEVDALDFAEEKPSDWMPPSCRFPRCEQEKAGKQ